VSADFFHIEHRESRLCENLDGGREGKIREVLVVNRVELLFRDESVEVREFAGEDAVRLEQRGASLCEVIDLGNMREDVDRNHEVRTQTPLGELLR